MMKKIILLIFLCVLTVNQAWAVPDAETLKAAERYYNVSESDKMLDNAIEKLKKNPLNRLTDEQLAGIKKSFDMKQYKSMTIFFMADTFTAKELNDLSDFYGTPEGKSIHEKQSVLAAKMMPYIQQTVMTALMPFLQQLKKNQATTPPAPTTAK
jgi:hypothetical protein